MINFAIRVVMVCVFVANSPSPAHVIFSWRLCSKSSSRVGLRSDDNSLRFVKLRNLWVALGQDAWGMKTKQRIVREIILMLDLCVFNLAF